MAFQLQYPAASNRVIEHFLQNPTYWKDYSVTGTDGTSHPLEGNDGISFEAPFRSEVKACAAGVVKAVNLPGDVLPHGNHVVIEHTDGSETYETTYCHLLEAKATVGQSVKAGDVIGLADSTGSAIGSTLRLILRKHGATAAGQTRYQTQDGRQVTLPNDTVDPSDYFVTPLSERFATRV
jgi:murein DD-endopeptidase MepM/ murein hydrolase activator NlpD